MVSNAARSSNQPSIPDARTGRVAGQLSRPQLRRARSAERDHLPLTWSLVVSDAVSFACPQAEDSLGWEWVMFRQVSALPLESGRSPGGLAAALGHS
jgi:hypothetical protein